jgi:hypothetical protein
MNEDNSDNSLFEDANGYFQLSKKKSKAREFREKGRI